MQIAVGLIKVSLMYTQVSLMIPCIAMDTDTDAPPTEGNQISLNPPPPVTLYWVSLSMTMTPHTKCINCIIVKYSYTMVALATTTTTS